MGLYDDFDDSEGDFDEDYDDDYDDEYSEYEEAFDECGRLPSHLGGGCQLAGTEHCDFECPFRDADDDED